MNENKKNLIVTLADANFLDQAKQLFSSVYFKAGWSGDYLLLASDIPEADLKWFKEKGILIYHCPPLSDKPVGSRNYPPVVLSKFYLFKEYFKQWDKIVFLDADIIIKSPLNDLLSVNNFKAVRTTFCLRDEFVREQRFSFKKIKSEHKLDGPAFNSGVFSFNANLIESDTFDKIFFLYNKIEQLSIHGEEATFNLFFYKKWEELPIIYNSMPFFMEKYYHLSKNKLLAAVIHFVNSPKPWEAASPYNQEWLINLQLAEKIDIQKPKQEILIDISLLRKYFKYLRFIDIKNFWRQPLLFLDSRIGYLGLFLKEKNPKLYKLISLKKHE